jgi:hypothetical protein
MKMASQARDGPAMPQRPQTCAQGNEMAQASENDARRLRRMKRAPGVVEMAQNG